MFFTSQKNVTLNVNIITNSYIASVNDDIIQYNNATGTATVSLPDATKCKGKLFYFQCNSESGTLLVQATLGQKITGSDTIPLVHGWFLIIFSSGDEWFILSIGPLG